MCGAGALARQRCSRRDSRLGCPAAQVYRAAADGDARVGRTRLSAAFDFALLRTKTTTTEGRFRSRQFLRKW